MVAQIRPSGFGSTGGGTSSPGRAMPGFTNQGAFRQKYNVPQLSEEQIAQILYMLGVRGQDLVDLTAISWRESAGGGDWIVGSPSGGNTHEWSFGIFGLNTMGGMWDFFRQHVPGLTDRWQLLNPIVSAQAALALKAAYGWRPWGEYKGVSHLTGTNPARAAVAVQNAQRMGLLGRQFDEGAFLPFSNSGATVAAVALPPTATPLPGAVNPSLLGSSQVITASGLQNPQDFAALSGGTGVVGTGTTGIPAPSVAPRTPAEIDAYVHQYYPQVAGFISDPEVGKVLREAAANMLSPELLFVELQKTAWWKKYSADEREWQLLKKTDPATAQARVNQASADVHNLAGQLGYDLSSADLTFVAEQMAARKWTTAQLTDFLNNYAGKTALGVGGRFAHGQLGAFEAQLEAETRKWLLPVNVGALNQASQNMASQQLTFDGYRAQLADQARKRFAANVDLLGGIDRGIAPTDFLGPQLAKISGLLGVDPAAIDLNDPKWSSVINQRTANGYRTATLDEAGRLARSQPEYINSSDGRRTLLKVSNYIDSIFHGGSGFAGAGILG